MTLADLRATAEVLAESEIVGLEVGELETAQDRRAPRRAMSPRCSKRSPRCSRSLPPDRWRHEPPSPELRPSGSRRCRRRTPARYAPGRGRGPRAASWPAVGLAEDVVAGLVHGRVLAQQVEGLGVLGVVGQRAAEQLEQAGVGRVGGGLGHQDREGGYALAQVGAGRLAGGVGLGGDVEDVVGELEGRADDLAVGAAAPRRPRGGRRRTSRRSGRTWRSASRSCRRRRRGSARAGPRPGRASRSRGSGPRRGG